MTPTHPYATLVAVYPALFSKNQAMPPTWFSCALYNPLYWFIDESIGLLVYPQDSNPTFAT